VGSLQEEMILESMLKRSRFAFPRHSRGSAKERALGTGPFPVKNRFARLQRDAVFALLVLLLAGGTVFALASGGAALQQQAHAADTSPPPRTHLVIGQARVIVDHVASSDAGLMQPAVDQRGNIWVGEMYANRFARFDSQREAITTWVAPHGNDGIMDTTVDAQGHPWFVEQEANYIARFDPATHTFHIFPLGKVGGRPLGPQDLQFDKRGLLWFTEMVPGKLGMFDPTTKKTTEIPIPAFSGHPAALYGLVSTPGGDIWCANSGANALVRYSPATATFTFYQLSTSYGGLYGLALASTGQLWFTIDGTAANYIGEISSQVRSS
jgi:hypothetical protein